MCDPEQVAIAIVDADSAVRDSFFPLLEGVGYSVCAYATGSDLLEALADHSPSVLLLGSQLPDINAHLLLKSVYDLGTKVPTIILANHSLELPRLEDMVPVPSALLLKPVDEEQLFAAIKCALDCESHGACGA